MKLIWTCLVKILVKQMPCYLQTTFTMVILRYYLVNLFFLLQTYTNILVSLYNRRENGMYILMK